MSVTIIDARHLLCPLPVIRTQDAVGKLQPGDAYRYCVPTRVLFMIFRPGAGFMVMKSVISTEQEYEITISIRVGGSGN